MLQTFITITLKATPFHNNAYIDTHFLLRMSLNNGYVNDLRLLRNF